jgi:hypothetical protein
MRQSVTMVSIMKIIFVVKLRATVKFHNALKAGPHWIHVVNLETISTV